MHISFLDSRIFNSFDTRGLSFFLLGITFLMYMMRARKNPFCICAITMGKILLIFTNSNCIYANRYLSANLIIFSVVYSNFL